MDLSKEGFLAEDLPAVYSTKSVYPLAYLLLIFAVFYAAQLVSFQIPVDAEMAAMRGAVDGWGMPTHTVWIQQGRWGTYLIERFIMPQPTVPFLPLAIFGFFMALAYLMILRACGIPELSFRHYATFPVFVAFPIWFFIAQFGANLFAAGLGMALSGAFLLAFRDTVRMRHQSASDRMTKFCKLYILQMVIATLTMSLYQSFTVLLLVGGFGIVLVSMIRSRSVTVGTLIDIVGLGLTVVAGVVLYAMTVKLSLLLTGEKISYIYNFFHPEALFIGPVQVASKVAQQIAMVYGGSEKIYGISAWSFALLPLVTLFTLGLSTNLRTQPVLRFMALAFLSLMLLLPFGLNLMNRGLIPYRSLFSVPLTLWFCVFICLEFGSPLARRAAGVALVLVLVQSLYIFSLFQASSAIARQYDQRLAEAIYVKIVSAREAGIRPRLPKVDFFGSASGPGAVYPVPRTETVGRSIFEWGEAKRIVALYRLLGYADIREVSQQERADLVLEFTDMGVWPDSSSVRVVGDTTLVKLSKTPNEEHAMYIRAVGQ